MPMFGAMAGKLLVAIVGLLVVVIRNRRYRDVPRLAQPRGAGRLVYVRRVWGWPEKTPPRLRVSAAWVHWYSGAGSEPDWVARPSEVTLEYVPGRWWWTGVPTVIVHGPNDFRARGRLTTDPRPPVGKDVALERQMVGELLDFVEYARQCDVRIRSSVEVPKPGQVDEATKVRW